MLILLRNSWLDKIFFIPITNITMKDFFKFVFFLEISAFIFFTTTSMNRIEEKTFNFFHFLLSMLIGIIIYLIFIRLFNVLKKRLSFISKSYFIDFFKKNNPIKSKRLQHFLDFDKLFSQLINISLQNYTFEQNTFSHISIKDSFLINIIFNKCSINKLNFNNTQFDNINFNECKINYMRFDNCYFKNVNIDISSFNQTNSIVKIFFVYLSFIAYLLSFTKTNKYRLKKIIFKGDVRKLIFANMDIEHFDDKSISNLKKAIKNYHINRKDILCSKELKDILFENNTLEN